VTRERKVGYLWNVGPWIKRLGLFHEQPRIAAEIVPVQILGDASALTTPLLPPMCWAGSVISAVVGENAGVAVRSGAPGGTFVRSVRFSVNTFQFTIRWEITENAPHVFGTLSPPPVLQQMGPIDANPIVRFGTTVASLGADLPATVEGGTLGLWIDEFYVAPGRELYMEGTGVDQGAQLALLLQDVEGQIPNEQAV